MKRTNMLKPWAQKSVLLFVGNPGTGKSSLLNALVGAPAFRSGIPTGQAGGGLTTIVQWVEHEGIVFGDTPGLSDIKRREEAAKEITKALKIEGSYKLLFVCWLDKGRIRGEDIATIALVLDALPTNTEFGIVVNGVSKKSFKEIQADERAWRSNFKAKHRGTDQFYWYPVVPQLEDADDEVHIPVPAFVDFLQNLRPTVIPSQVVKDIQPSKFDSLLVEARQQIESLREALAKRDKIIEQQRKQIEEALTQSQTPIVPTAPPPPPPAARVYVPATPQAYPQPVAFHHVGQPLVYGAYNPLDNPRDNRRDFYDDSEDEAVGETATGIPIYRGRGNGFYHVSAGGSRVYHSPDEIRWF